MQSFYTKVFLTQISNTNSWYKPQMWRDEQVRNETEMMELILHKAIKDERIRAVLMTGLRVNPNVKKDIFQDYDIAYIVSDIESFTANHRWVDRFGPRIMMQIPEDMVVYPSSSQCEEKAGDRLFVI